MSRHSPAVLLIAMLVVQMLLTACGGGTTGTSSGSGSGSGSSGSGSGSGTGVTAPGLIITTPTLLPGTMHGVFYRQTLTAANGNGQLRWSITPTSPTSLFPDGLSINTNTGEITGTVEFRGTAGFFAEVTDSSAPPRTAKKAFAVTSFSKLTVAPSQSAVAGQYHGFSWQLSFNGGVPPHQLSISSGSLPPGLRLNSLLAIIEGAPHVPGTYNATITIQDSFSPTNTATLPITIKVEAPALALMQSLPPELLLNVPFSGSIVARGGVPPYTFFRDSGDLPSGLAQIETNTGRLRGTPNTSGSYNFVVRVRDSSSPVQSTISHYQVLVAPPLGRNDTPATATRLGGGRFEASISPYIDPPNGPHAPADNDYYKLVAPAGTVVHLETDAKRQGSGIALDTVIEIADPNGTRLSACRQPGDTSENFTSPCINDDLSGSPHVQDSALDFKVPGTSGTLTSFLVRVLDWSGHARPDLRYSLIAVGVVEPLKITTLSVPGHTPGVAYSQQLSATGGDGSATWSIAQGGLPPGLNLSSTGLISGSGTTNGTYTFKVKAQNGDNPDQIATAQFTIAVGDPAKILVTTLPDACKNRPYSYTVPASGGAPPLVWGFISSNWMSINLDNLTGTFSGTTSVVGIFTGSLSVTDSAGSGERRQISLTVRTCPT